MKTDFYTKSVLTIIAICLSIFTLQNLDLVPKANASNTKDLIPMKNYGLVPINADGTIDVNIKNTSTIDVNIQSCSSKAFFYAEPIEVKINN